MTYELSYITLVKQQNFKLIHLKYGINYNLQVYCNDSNYGQSYVMPLFSMVNEIYLPVYSLLFNYSKTSPYISIETI